MSEKARERTACTSRGSSVGNAISAIPRPFIYLFLLYIVIAAARWKIILFHESFHQAFQLLNNLFVYGFSWQGDRDSVAAITTKFSLLRLSFSSNCLHRIFEANRKKRIYFFFMDSTFLVRVRFVFQRLDFHGAAVFLRIFLV